MRLSPRISRVFGHTDRPSTDLATTTRRSNTRGAFSMSSSSTGPRNAEPNVWITDMESCRRHNLHLTIDGQSQWCSLIFAAQPCDNCLRQSRAVSQQTPPAVADAQQAWHGAQLFREWGSLSPDEFSSIRCFWKTRLSPMLCLWRWWKCASPQSKLSVVARRSSMLQMSGTAS